MIRRALGRALETPPLTAIGVGWPWTAPWVIRRAAGTAEAVPEEAVPFTVLSANALGPNRRANAFATELTAVDTDVLIVVEASDRILDALEAVEVSRYHRHGLIEKRPRWGGCGIWSRHPMALVEAGDAGYAYIAARVDVPGGPVTVVAVHTIAPAKLGSGPGWVASFEVLGDVIERLDGPIVAAGDYNATLGHGPMRRLLARTGLRDAHTAAGRGLARSWPDGRFVPALGLIDRVLLSSEVAVASIAERRMPGSDHRAILATLVVRTSAPAPPG